MTRPTVSSFSYLLAFDQKGFRACLIPTVEKKIYLPWEYLILVQLPMHQCNMRRKGNCKRKWIARKGDRWVFVAVQCSRTAIPVLLIYTDHWSLFLRTEAFIQLTFMERDKNQSFMEFLNVSEVINHFQGFWVITLCAVHGCFQCQ